MKKLSDAFQIAADEIWRKTVPTCKAIAYRFHNASEFAKRRLRGSFELQQFSFVSTKQLVREKKLDANSVDSKSVSKSSRWTTMQVTMQKWSTLLKSF